MSDLWLPGQGVVPSNVRAAQTAIEQYDPDLELGFNERNQEWVVLSRKGPDGAPFPVFGLGQTLPSYDEIQRMLHNADVRKHGAKLVAEVVARNEAKKKANRFATSEAAGEVAETLEYAFRRMGKTSHKRVYLPGKDFKITP